MEFPGQGLSAHLRGSVATGGFVLQPHKDVAILLGLHLECFIIFQSNGFNICLQSKKGKREGEEKRWQDRKGSVRCHRHAKDKTLVQTQQLLEQTLTD